MGSVVDGDHAAQPAVREGLRKSAQPLNSTLGKEITMTSIKRAIVFSTLFFMSFSAYAGCAYLAELYSSSLYIDISDGGCGEFEVSFSTKIGKNGQPEAGSIKSFPFNEECELVDAPNIPWETLTCHQSGRTPLAGATYKRKPTGKYKKHDDCGEPITDGHKIEIWQYVCVSGCNQKGVPKTLDQPSVCGG